jgi:hypothetical protein
MFCGLSKLAIEASWTKKALFSARRVKESLAMVHQSQLTVETIPITHACGHMNRRKFVAAVCGLAFSADAAPLLAAPSKRNKTTTLLRKLPTASFHKKMELLQELYEGVAFHESGIIYSMQRMDADGIRPFVAADFEGQIGINPSVAKLQLRGPWEYLHGENSISASEATESWPHEPVIIDSLYFHSHWHYWSCL